MSTIPNCRICGSSELIDAIDLGEQPWGNHFLSRTEVGLEQRYPLRVVWCPLCCGAQLDFTVPKEVMFVKHTYLSGTTKSLTAHFSRVAKSITERYFQSAFGKGTCKVLDIGSNDGTLLRQFRDLGWDVTGVESSVIAAEIANSAGIRTINTFYNEKAQDDLNESFDLIHASGVFFHLEELHSVTRAVKSALLPNGVFVVQFLYMKSIMVNGAFDQIYHEHLLYYTLRSLGALLEQHGLEIFDADADPIHGGSIIAHIGHQGLRVQSTRLKGYIEAESISGCNELKSYQELQRKAAALRERDLIFLDSCSQKGRRVYGLGAPVKGNTLLNFLGVGEQHIQCLVERNPLRKGTYAPGSHIPVLMEDEISGPPDVYYVLAWNFKQEILERYRSDIDAGVEFYFPIDPKVL